jgi:hypothetical protein
MSVLFKLTIVPFNAWSIEAYEGMPFILLFLFLLCLNLLLYCFSSLIFLFSDLLETFPLLMMSLIFHHFNWWFRWSILKRKLCV